MYLSIILPTRNEEVLIKGVLEDISSFLQRRKINNYEILVIINGSIDKTEKIVAKAASKNKRIKVANSNPGYGVAMRKGLKLASGKYIAIFNVDFYDLKMLDFATVDLFEKDLIIGSKMTYWADDKRPYIRKIVSKLFNGYLRFAFKFEGSDTHGIKIMRKEVVKEVLPKCKTDSGIFDSEFVLRVQRMNFSIADYPVSIMERRTARFSNRLLSTPMDMWKLYRYLNE